MKKKIRKMLPIFLTVLLFVLVFFALRNFEITEVGCRSQYGKCNFEVKSKLENIKGCNYFSCKRNINEALSGSIIVDKYNYQFKLPSKIEVNIVEKKHKYSIKNVSQNRAAQIDSEGLVLDIREESNLPGIVIQDDLPDPGEKVTTEEYFSLELVYGTTKIQSVTKAFFESDGVYVELEDGTRVIFPRQGDRDLILGTLTLILNELKKEDVNSRISERQVKEIDLRYNNPILR